MNATDKNDLKTILEHLDEQDGARKDLKARVDSIHICLMGKDNNHKDMGLVGDVDRNTRFRKWFTYLGTTVIMGNIIALVRYCWDYFSARGVK